MPDSSQNEATLIQQAIAGDKDAFGELYMLHLDAIYRYVYFRTADTCTAEDLTEQVFLKAWQKLSGYHEKGNGLAAWLFKIARNVVIDHYRCRKPMSEIPLPEHDDWESEQSSALERVIATEETGALAAAIARLPEDQQQVIILRFVEGLKHAEVASILEKSIGACRVIQYRALATLNELLKSS